MIFLLTLIHRPEAMLYCVQGITYGLACWAIRGGRHAPWQVYLASSVIHLGLGLVHALHAS